MPRLKDGYVRKPTRCHAFFRTTTCFHLGDLMVPGWSRSKNPLRTGPPFSNRHNRSTAHCVHCCDLVVSTHLKKYAPIKVGSWKPNFLGVRMKKTNILETTTGSDLGCLLLANHLLDQMAGDARLQDPTGGRYAMTDSSCLAVGDAPGLQCRDFFGASLEALPWRETQELTLGAYLGGFLWGMF